MKVENWNGYDIRFVEHNDEWWAIAKDVTDALGLSNPTMAMHSLKENEVALCDLSISEVTSSRARKTQTMNIISEKVFID